LARGELDAALGPPAAGADELQSHALFSERYVGLVKRGGVLDQAAGSRRQLPAAVLRGARLVVVDQAATHHRVVPALLASRGLQSQVVAVVPLFAAVPGLVDAFDAVALVPSEIAALYARRRVAAWVHLPWALPAFPICWVTHPSRHRDAGLAWLGREVVAAVAARGSRAAPRAARREPAAP
jgi:DNA-binding transcriptional LysR family regulator